MTTTSKTASATLTALADLAAGTRQPTARAEVTAATLRQIAALPSVQDMPLTIADACAGYTALGLPREDADPRVASRRKTCAELGALAPADGGDPLRLAAVLAQVRVDLWMETSSEHLQALAITTAREAVELTSVAAGS